jgi:hypothetical protein
MHQESGNQSLEEFFAWMDQLNVEAVQRGFWHCPLPKDIAHSRNCWIEDFSNGLTPTQALDAQFD